MANREAAPFGTPATTPGAAMDEMPVWDAFVRVVHWTLVLTFAAAYLSGDEESALHVLAAVAVTAVSGMALRDPADPFLGGAAAVSLPVPIAPARAGADGRDDGANGEENQWLEETHEFLANVTLALVLMHVTGVLWGSWRHRENLIRAMITGRKRANGI